MSRSTISTFKLFELFPDEGKEPQQVSKNKLLETSHGEWGHAADSYGKVQHSKKACVYTTFREEGKGDQIVTVAARISNWDDAKIMAAAKELYAALKYMNHVDKGYCICPLKDGMARDTQHSTACSDARQALRKVESDWADWRNDPARDGGSK